MRHRRLPGLIVLLSLQAIPLFAADAPPDGQAVESKVQSIGLFKNGLAVVERTVELPGPGLFRIEDVPTPVHGTFFVESATPLTTRTTTMLVNAPLDLTRASLQEQLAGKTVRVTIREKDAPVEGKVAAIETEQTHAWSRRYEAPGSGLHYDAYGNRMIGPSGAGRFLVLETRDGRSLVDQGMITSIDVAGDTQGAKQRKPVLLLQLGENAPAQTVRISYLAKGIAWAPSYRVQLLADNRLSIGQSAVIKNELMALTDVEVSLISGFPSIDFAHVDSPLSLQQNWASFFRQLAQRPGEGGLGNRAAMAQQVMMNSINHGMEGGPGLGITPPDESIDVHYESIGRHTLSEGDAISLEVAAAAQADYERIVEWNIPDSRNEHGLYRSEGGEGKDDADAAWDAVRFKNPLPFPMTTAPATFVNADGRFLGQQLSRWVNRGEETTLRMTKALSIRTRASEKEDAGAEREDVWVGGRRYRKVSAQGELVVKNYRKTDARIVITRQFSGDLTKADGEPAVTLREEGMWSVNRRSEMKWTITLKPGEERTLTYAYSLLASR